MGLTDFRFFVDVSNSLTEILALYTPRRLLLLYIWSCKKLTSVYYPIENFFTLSCNLSCSFIGYLVKVLTQKMGSFMLNVQMCI